MSKGNNIDDLFKDGLGNASYDFNPDNWKEMESTLNSRDRLSWFKKSAIVGAATLVGAFGIYQYDFTKEVNTDIAQNNTLVESDSKPSDKLILSESNAEADLVDSKVVENEVNQTKNEKIEPANLLASATNKEELKPLNHQSIPFSSIELGDVSQSSEEVENVIVLAKVEDNLIDEAHSNATRVSELVKMQFQNAHINETYTLEDFQFSMTDPADLKNIRQKRSYLSVMGAINLGNDLGGDGVFSLNILHAVGLKYGIHLSNNLMMETGLNYRSRSGNGAKLVYENVEYGFGKTVTTTEINTRSLHYLELPLDLKYAIANKHTIYGGASLSYLMNVRSEVNTNTDESLKPQSQESERLWGHQHGFKSIDVGLRTGYEYEIIDNLNIGLMATYGLVDITDDKKFNNNSSDNNLELRLRVQYKLVNF